MFSVYFVKNELAAQTLWIDSILFIPQSRHPWEKNTWCMGSQLIVPPLLLKTRLLSSTSLEILHFPTINISPSSRGIVWCVLCLAQQIFILVAVFRICDILVRIRILGSVPLTNGSGSGCRCGFVPKSSVTFRMPKNPFLKYFLLNEI